MITVFIGESHVTCALQTIERPSMGAYCFASHLAIPCIQQL